MKKVSGYLFAALLATVFWPEQASAQLDKVFVGTKPKLEGVVTEITRDKVTLDIAGAPRTFDVNEITKISYGDEPAVLTKSRDAVLGGQLEAPLLELNSLNPDTVSREEIKQDLLYYRAYCTAKLAIQTGGNRDQALAGLLEFVKGNSSSYHFFEAAELLGDLASAAGNYDGAAKYYAGLAKAPWPDYKLRANVLEGRALSAQKKWPEALDKFEAVIGSGEANAEANRQKLMATVGKAVCLAETGKHEEGIKLVEDLIKNNDSSKEAPLFARAYNALGSCQLKANRQKEALMAFLHVHLLYFNVGDAHAEALFHLTKLWSDVNKADRSIEARTTLKERYGGSPWAKAL